MKTAMIKNWAPCLALCVVISSPAQATVLFQGNAIGSFSNAEFGANDYIAINNRDAGAKRADAASFAWGTVSAKLSCVGDGGCEVLPKPKSGSSQLSFDGVGSDAREKGYSAKLGKAFSLGAFEYVNRSVHFAEGVTGVDFSVDVGFKNIALTKPFSYHISIDNTPDSPADMPDMISLTDTPSPFSFISGGNAYQFSLLGFSLDHGASFENSFSVNEGRSIKAALYGRFDPATASIPSPTTTPVPLPAAFWLLGSGLVGLFGLGRQVRKIK